MFGQSQTDVLEKMDRPDQLIFQIGIIQPIQKDLSISAEVWNKWRSGRDSNPRPPA
ncbi:hypothetical protein FORC53_0122 [Vibrio vulnificus]|uniref:Uncharacterized protein n=1 Tax=Vibrio vulnificus TaxID=672 RepID=A0AAN1PLG6_VIBVL|nr:hypothetical protein FORC53_0122 [Vibrio vulnificus]